MNFNRQSIRGFITSVEWATASNIYHLFGGRIPLRDISSDLIKMTRCKNSDLKLRLLEEEVQVYAMASGKRKTVHHQHFRHDVRLRDCLAQYIFKNGWKILSTLAVNGFADAQQGQSMFFEMDNGTMAEDQLKDKIKKYYLRDGAYQVIFWMYPKEYVYHRDVERIKALEQKRLEMLFDIVKKVLKTKPNRILANGYHDYLKDGKLYNYRMEEK